jgi:stalled ribosome rescue protein Dom34
MRSPHRITLRGTMSDKVGIWIDHKKAVIVTASADGLATTTLASEVEAHPHFGGQQDGGGEKKYEERRRHDLDRYYDEVISRVTTPGGLLVLGPGEAKREFVKRFSQVRPDARCVVDIETTGALTDPQIAAKVQEHFSIAR